MSHINQMHLRNEKMHCGQQLRTKQLEVLNSHLQNNPVKAKYALIWYFSPKTPIVILEYPASQSTTKRWCQIKRDMRNAIQHFLGVTDLRTIMYQIHDSKTKAKKQASFPTSRGNHQNILNSTLNTNSDFSRVYNEGSSVPQDWFFYIFSLIIALMLGAMVLPGGFLQGKDWFQVRYAAI